MSVDFNLDNLPYPTAITEVSFSNNLRDLILKFQELEPNWSAFLESDPIVKEFEAMAYVLTQKDQVRNEQIKAVLISSSEGPDLDNRGALLGVAREIDEPDERFRSRILLAIDKVSTAGAKGYYEALTYDADTRVEDVLAYDVLNEPGKAFVVIQSTENDDGIASQDLLDTVFDYLNHEDRRPLGCQVIVSAITPINYIVEAEVQLQGNVDSNLIIQSMKNSISELVESKKRIEGKIALSEIYASLNVEGVAVVQNLVSPISNIAVANTEVPICTDIIITEV